MIRPASRCDHPTRRLAVLPRWEEGDGTTLRIAVSRLFGGAVVVYVQGEIDMLTVPELRRGLLGALDPDVTMLALDMARVGYLGASGLAALVEVLDAVEAAGGRMCVVSPSRSVRLALDIVGLSGRFNVHPAPVELAS